MKTSTEQSLQSTSTAARVTVTDLCHDPRALLECDDQQENMTSVIKTGNGPDILIARYKKLLKHYKKEAHSPTSVKCKHNFSSVFFSFWFSLVNTIISSKKQ